MGRMEWSFQDGVRSFIKADYGSLADMAERLTGSPRMFMSSQNFHPAVLILLLVMTVLR